MKKNEVPQDDEAIYQNKFGEGLIKYATDEDNQYTTVQSAGWEPEIVALKQAWEEVEEKIEAARLGVAEGRFSPVFYFMEKKLMDPGILASYMGKWKWQIRRHFKPSVFNKLDRPVLHKYAQVFGIDVDELINFDSRATHIDKK